MRKTKKAGWMKRRLMTGLCCLGLFASELAAAVPVWAMEPVVAEQTQDAGSDESDDTQISDGGNEGNQPQNPGGEEGDGNGTQNPGEEGGENDGETPDVGDEGNQPQNPGGEDEGNQPQNPDGENDGNGEQTPGEGNDEAQEPGGEEVSEDSEEETITKEETEADQGNADAAVYGDAVNKISWNIDSSGCLTITGTGDYEVDDNGNPAWWERREEILSAVVDVSGITSTSKMFYECSKMRQIDLSKLDTGKVTDMSDMFSGCKALHTLDLSSFDTGNVTNMSGMFSDCRYLSTLNVGSFDTGNVTDMSYMFYYCQDLFDVSIRSFDTGNVTNMSYMFSYCSRNGLDISGFNTGNVTDMSGMFFHCSSNSLDISGFNTGNVTDMSRMFFGSQMNVDFSHFNTENVTNMSYMFASSRSRYSILDLSSFDTRNVTNMSGMFMSCESLTGADVSSFDTKKVTDMSSMFMLCGKLTKLDLSNFEIGIQTDVRSMIFQCNSLASVSVPKNLPENIEISLPAKSDDKWYDDEYNTYTALPTGLQESITLYKNAFVDDGSGTWKMVLQISGITIESKTYDGEPLAYTGTAVARDMKGNIITDVIINERYEVVKRENQGDVIEVIAEAPDQAGSYRLVFSVEENEKYTAERIYNFDIKWKSIAVTAPTVSIEVGEALPSIDEMTYKAEGFLGDDTFITEPKLKYEKENISTDVSGSYKIIPYGAAVGNNYRIAYKNGTLLVEKSVAKGTTNNITWRLNGAGVLRITGTGNYETDADGKPPWCNVQGVKSVVVNVSDIMSTRNMFYGLGKVSYGIHLKFDLSDLDTSKVTDMSGMFMGCGIDGTFSLNSLDTSKVTDMSDMFMGCEFDGTLNLDSLDTSSVTDMSGMFQNSKINYPYRKTLDLRGFDTSKVTNMREMFCGSRVGNVDLSGYNTENVTDMGGMFSEFGLFYGEEGRLKLDLRSFRTDKVEDMSYMFYDCRGVDLENLNVLNTGSVKNMSYMFANDGFNSSYNLTEADLSGFNTGNVTDMSHMFENSEAVKVDVSGFDTGNVTDMSYMFANSKTEKLDVSGFDTKNVTNMSHMFENSKAVEVNMSNRDMSCVTDMSGMFYNNKAHKVDMSGVNAEHVVDMNSMFNGCYAGEVDMRGFSAKCVENMGYMFADTACVSLDLSGFDFSHVTNMDTMFSSVVNEYVEEAPGANIYLQDLNLGNFNISKIKSAYGMFAGLSSLTSIHMDSVDTSGITDMSDMFYKCNSLESLDLSGFDTSNVTAMVNMFYGCRSLKNLDVSSFDTRNVTSMRNMFYGCDSLTLLDLSSFDMGKVKKSEDSDRDNDKGMFSRRARLNMIFTPRNVRRDCFEYLPGEGGDVWYRINKGKAETVMVLPQGLEKSILITRDEPPKVQDGIGGITVKKEKTVYLCGETINTDDLTVVYCGADGSLEKLAKNQYTTNAEQIDVTTVGERKLVVTYVKDGKELQAEIAIMVTYGLTAENTTVTLPSEADYNYIYNGQPKTPLPAVEMTMASGGADSAVRLTENTDYTISYRNNVNAYGETADGASGTAAPTVIIEGKGNYRGTVRKTFTIQKADAPAPQTKNVTAVQCTVAQENRSVDISKNFAVCGKKTYYEVIGVEDPKGIFYRTPTTNDIRGGTLYYSTNAAQEGDTAFIKVRVSFANYEDAELTVKITMSDEGVAYTVAFDGMGHCDGFMKGSIKAGSLLELTDSERMPAAEGYVFAGWYKDKGFAQNQEWNFDTDTVQSDLTLYACWLTGAAQDGNGMKLCVQEIPDLTYTGSAQKPAVTVYDSDGTTRLKAGKDYTVKYVNNINAVAVGADGKPAAAGGTARVTDFGKPDKEKITNVSGTFSKDIPYVAITGKGNYTETVCRNFLILPAQIADGTPAGSAEDAADTPLAAGFTLKYTDQLVVNHKKDQNPFGSLKYKKAMKAGTDFTVSLGAAGAQSAWTTGADGTKGYLAADWTAEGKVNGKQYTLPTIPKGYSGAFILTVTGKGNYAGTARRKLYVSEKQNLMKNASITLGKNQKTVAYRGEDILLTPGYYDAETKKYHKVTADGVVSDTAEANANNIFLVKAGKNGKAGGESLVWGRDYTIDYTGTNRAVGTATLTLTGINGYVGTKSVTFKITGGKFVTNTIDVKAYDSTKSSDDPQMDAFRTSLPYTGRAVTQNRVLLTTKVTQKNPSAKKLVYGEHYTIAYKNNVKKGTATMTFTALPASGYTGSFKKTYKITPQELTRDRLTVLSQNGEAQALYSKNGAKLSFTVMNEAGTVLREGTDYTVKYQNNTAVTTAQTADNKKPLMTVTGKGNYAGKVEVSFTVVQASLADALNDGIVTVSCAQVQKKDGMKFKDFKLKLTEGKKALGVGETKDYIIDETKCTPEIIQAYADALAAGTTLPAEPVVKVTGKNGYAGGAAVEIPLGRYIYAEKLTAACVYAVVSEGAKSIYTGGQVMPEVSVYYGDKMAVSEAKKDKVKEAALLTAQDGKYKLTKLVQRPSENVGDAKGDGYIVNYGVNIAAGKNKGSVTVTGAGRYGGSVTVKFTIGKKTL